MMNHISFVCGVQQFPYFTESAIINRGSAIMNLENAIIKHEELFMEFAGLFVSYDKSFNVYLYSYFALVKIMTKNKSHIALGCIR